jgi:two-component system OmpR family response regulator
MQILLVEDDAEVARFVKKGLQEAGHIVEHVANGRDGLFMAASEPFDLLILDNSEKCNSLVQVTYRFK